MDPNLEELLPQDDSTLIIYVDDLFLCSSSIGACEIDSGALLHFVAKKGNKFTICSVLCSLSRTFDHG